MSWKTSLCAVTLVVSACSGSNDAAQADSSGDPLVAAPASALDFAHNLQVRSYDGSNNNRANPLWGAADQPFLRSTTLAYGDGVDSMGGADRPNPRDISNAVVAQSASILNRAHVSDLVWQWGQFIDHDLTLTPAASPAESMSVPIPTGEPIFDPKGTGTQVIPANRSDHKLVNGHREQINRNTAFVDASMVYGSDPARAADLRARDGTGRLKNSAGNLLPFNTFGLPNVGVGGQAAPSDQTLFVAGDVRANEQVGLTSMHTLWMREHNRLATLIGNRQPWLSDEQRYQAARALVIAQIEKITYRDFLPILVGRVPAYRGYDATVNPGIENFFAGVAYRVGHTLLSPALQVLGPDGTSLIPGGLSLREAFFNPGQFIRGGLMEPLIRGQASQVAQEVDTMIVDPVRNFLFGNPGQGGLDLASLNIQRARELGLPCYAQARVDFGLARPQSFADVSSDPVVQQRLASIYASVEDIDPWVGALAEDHFDGGLVGELIATVVRDQFQRARDGDRFYYERTLPWDLQQWVNRRTLGHVIRNNTAIGNELQSNVFYASSN